MATTHSGTVALTGVAGLTATKTYRLSKTVNTLVAGEPVAAPYAQSFAYTFPPQSVTVFRFVPAGTK